ncbi:MAG: hypothetical protein QOJ42_3985 [Acidobacteriaceae bacterium]|nr:hypothetical protein [Acidobacteriaceae bacterium]
MERNSRTAALLVTAAGIVFAFNDAVAQNPTGPTFIVTYPKSQDANSTRGFTADPSWLPRRAEVSVRIAPTLGPTGKLDPSPGRSSQYDRSVNQNPSAELSHGKNDR